MILNERKVLALDFGGTKLTAAVVDKRNGEICSLVCHPTPSLQDATACITTMFDMGRQALKECNLVAPARVGISFGGPVSTNRKEVLMSCHVAGWEGIPLPKLTREVFNCPVAMDNDANAAALGSWYFDAHGEPENMVYIQVSTGIGSGLILNRNLYRGGGIAGEFGHITIIPDGPKCVCGKRGCLESLCAGWALAQAGRELLNNTSKESALYQLCQGDPSQIDARLLIQAAQIGDSQANAIIKQAFTALGIAIANMITLFDPQVIMLGGGITRAQGEMRAALNPVITRELHPLFKERYKLQFSHLDGKETLLGAALLHENNQ